MKKNKLLSSCTLIFFLIISSGIITNAASYAISGKVFDDKNCNGQRNAGDSGIDGVTITLVSGALNVSTAPDGTYSFTNLDPGTYTITETEPAGYNSSTPNSKTVRINNKSIGNVNFGDCKSISPLSINYPKDSATINEPFTIIKGKINSSTQEYGVVVNGVIAQVLGSEFIANHIPLGEGWNTITADGTDADGSKFQASIKVYCQPTTKYVELTSNIDSGISPLNITLIVDTNLTNQIANASLTYTGPSTLTITTISSTEYNTIMTSEGIYTYTITVTDNQGNRYEDSIGVSVLSKDNINVLLKGKWNSMVNALSKDDAITALSQIASGSKESYKTMFTILKNQLPSVLSTIKEFNLINITDNVAKYELLTSENSKTYSYEVIFIKDKDGVWRIKEF